MAKGYASPGADNKKAAAAKNKAAAEQQPAAPSNDMLANILAQAAAQEGVDSEQTVLALTEQEVAPAGKYDFAEDGGKYDWAEDGDRVQQQEELPGLRPKHEGKEYKDIANAQAFIKGEGDAHAIDPNDVAQGALGDCYLIAGMAAVARANPEAIQNLIKDNGDGTFDVTLYIRQYYYSKPTKVTKTVDARMPMNGSKPLYAKAGDKNDEGTELWTSLIEKTVAQHKGSYDLISGGNINKGFEFHGATELLTGKKEGYMALSSLDEDDALLHIAIALDDKQPCTCDSLNMSEDQDLASAAKKFNVYGNHAYVPSSVDLDGRTVDLQNPWGSHHVENLPIADFFKFYRSIRVGA
ncbi:MAG: hypothetical protein KC912_23030 [Proteobacteria bacterium]|nr:hypothetical protein [Pseudomonadota bacterium]